MIMADISRLYLIARCLWILSIFSIYDIASDHLLFAAVGVVVVSGIGTHIQKLL